MTLEFRGEYGKATVYTDSVEQSAISQLYDLLNTPLAEGAEICVMPDCHAGAGCVIGLTMTITDKVCPNLVGVDIGCGVCAARISNAEHIDFEKLDTVIRDYVPSGFSVHDEEQRPVNCDTSLHCRDYVDIPRAMRSVGTLGGGNHFIEVAQDTDGYFWLIIHTGSRKFGLDIANYYQKLATTECRDKGVPKPLAYLEGEQMRDYLHDMRIAQDYAEENRRKIVQTILREMGWRCDDIFATVHNYIDFNKRILRKGAVEAGRGTQLIVPMNMRDGSLLCVGKGNPKWNYSAPHGAGRLMGRGEAKRIISIDDFKASMDGIYTSCVSLGTIDESPMAYKPMDEITKHIGDTAEILDVLKPVYSFKAGA
jgi:RNA-splicing ligase RtcB